MAKLFATRGAQWPLVAEFTFGPLDTVVDTTGATKDLGAVGTSVFDSILLPPSATVISGEVVTEVAVTGSTAYNVSVGDSANATRYLGVTDKTTAARTALVPTGYVGLGENIRLTVSGTANPATAGRITVRVQYVIRGKMDSVQTS